MMTGEIHEISAKIGALEAQASALQTQMRDCRTEFNNGFESLRCRLDLIAGLHSDVKELKDTVATEIKPTVDDYNSKKNYFIGAVGFCVFVWGSTIEAVKGILKAIGISQ